jgi:hypothetical protein
LNNPEELLPGTALPSLRRASYQAISDLPRPNPLDEFFINPKKIAAALRRSVVHTELGFKVLRAFRHSVRSL